MATANTAAKNEAASDFAADYSTATLTIKAGATALAVHTLAGFGAPTAGLITANAIAGVTNAATGTADVAELTAAGKTYTLTVGTSGAEVNINDLDYVAGGDSVVNSLTVQF